MSSSSFAEKITKVVYGALKKYEACKGQSKLEWFNHKCMKEAMDAILPHFQGRTKEELRDSYYRMVQVRREYRDHPRHDFYSKLSEEVYKLYRGDKSGGASRTARKRTSKKRTANRRTANMRKATQKTRRRTRSRRSRKTR